MAIAGAQVMNPEVSLWMVFQDLLPGIEAPFLARPILRESVGPSPCLEHLPLPDGDSHARLCLKQSRRRIASSGRRRNIRTSTAIAMSMALAMSPPCCSNPAQNVSRSEERRVGK